MTKYPINVKLSRNEDKSYVLKKLFQITYYPISAF